MDQESFLALRWVVLTPQRYPLERYEFVDIDLAGTVEQTPAIESIPECSSDDRPESLWTTLRAPNGFQIIDSSHQADSSKDKIILSDGLATISVTVEPILAPQFPPGHTNLGATNILISYLTVEQNIYLATLVGEVPLLSLELIVSGLAPMSDTVIQ